MSCHVSCYQAVIQAAPDQVLEVTARAITYYLDVSAECTRRIVAVEGAVKAICTRLEVVDLSNRTSRDLSEQCIKVLELVCTREAGSVFEAGGLTCVLAFIRDSGAQIHKVRYYIRYNNTISGPHTRTRCTRPCPSCRGSAPRWSPRTPPCPPAWRASPPC